MASFRRDIKDFERLREIATILVKQGFHSLLLEAKLAKHARISARIVHGAKRAEGTPARVRETLEQLGPTFVKLGQVLSLRPDLVPPEYCEEFKKLQDRVEPLPFPIIKAAIETELKQPLMKLFKTFDHNPLAAASVSQVHAAMLKDGTAVVVKVQRPGIRDRMERDIDIMEYLAAKLDRHIKSVSAVAIVDEFKQYTEKELDFTFELRNVKRFRDYFAEKKNVVIPEPFAELSTGKVMTLQRIRGVRVSDKARLKKDGYSLPNLARIGLRAVVDQVFELGVFHADPHPGNLIALHHGGEEALAFIDFGIVGFVDDELRWRFLELLRAMVDRDARDVTRTVFRIAETGPRCDRRAFEKDVAAALDEWHGATLREERMSLFLYKILDAAMRNDVHFPANIVLVAKAFLTIEGAGSWLDPDLNITVEVKPLIDQLLRKRFGPRQVAKDLAGTARDLHDVLQDVPLAAEALIDRVKDGKVELTFDRSEFRRIEHDYDLEMSKRNLAIVTVAFLFSGVLLAGLARDLLFFGVALYIWAFVLFLISFSFFFLVSIKIHKYLQQRL